MSNKPQKKDDKTVVPPVTQEEHTENEKYFEENPQKLTRVEEKLAKRRKEKENEQGSE